MIFVFYLFDPTICAVKATSANDDDHTPANTINTSIFVSLVATSTNNNTTNTTTNRILI